MIYQPLLLVLIAGLTNGHRGVYHSNPGHSFELGGVIEYGDYVFSGGQDTRVVAWNRTTGSYIQDLGNPGWVQRFIIYNGYLYAVGRFEGISKWDLATLEPMNWVTTASTVNFDVVFWNGYFLVAQTGGFILKYSATTLSLLGIIQPHLQAVRSLY